MLCRTAQSLPASRIAASDAHRPIGYALLRDLPLGEIIRHTREALTWAHAHGRHTASATGETDPRGRVPEREGLRYAREPTCRVRLAPWGDGLLLLCGTGILSAATTPVTYTGCLNKTTGIPYKCCRLPVAPQVSG